MVSQFYYRISASCSGLSFFFLAQNFLRFTGTLSSVFAVRCTLVLEVLHRRAISPSVRVVVLFSALIVAFASSGILFLPGML